MSYAQSAAQSFRTKIQNEVAKHGYDQSTGIPESMTFLQWCEDLAEKGMKVDQKPFSLKTRPALIPIYEAIPTTRQEAHKKTLVVQKATQIGLTIWEVLADIYMALKWAPVNIGLYLPDIASARNKSNVRFMPTIRSIPELLREVIYRKEPDGSTTRIGEGNVMTRAVGTSWLMFLWASGKTSTESNPFDIVSLDEVQNMTLAQIEKVRARTGDSPVAFSMLLSTANLPDSDINFWFKLGTQEVWHTRCLSCDELSDLSDPVGIFPERSIAYNTGDIGDVMDPETGTVHEPPFNEFVYICPHCQSYIPDPQRGEYVQQNDKPESGVRSFLLPRTLSPTETARKIMDDWNRARGGELKKNFYNRTLARPYIDPSQLPVTLEHCLAASAAGKAAGLVWETEAAHGGYVMGIDQMGEFHCVIVKKRMPDGRMGVVHVEAVFGADPWQRSAAIMRQFKISICVLEQLPNFDNARRFANLFHGRVFLATAYRDLADDTMHWGDDLSRSDKRTAEEDRTRYTVTINRYKAMQTSLFRIRDRLCIFPDPAELTQNWVEGNVSTPCHILLDKVFYHFTKTGLVVVTPPETMKRKADIAKIGIDPHFSFANMLCDIAWARENGTTMMILPQGPLAAGAVTEQGKKIAETMPGLPHHVAAMLDSAPPETCGACTNFDEKRSYCTARGLTTLASDPMCLLYEPKPTYP